jgi:hypothetical protein
MQRLRVRYLLAMGLPATVVGCPGPEPVTRVEVPALPTTTATATATATPTVTASVVATATATASASVPTTNPASPTLPVGVQTWHVSFPSSNPTFQRWGCSASAVCFRLADLAHGFGVADTKAAKCPAVIKVAQGCTPGAGCFAGERDQLVDALPVAAISSKESAKGQACCFEEPSHCIPPNAGRALRDQDDRLAVAKLEARSDWAGVATTTRTADTERWAAMAVAEHASIASFARVALELLALGAPPDLVEATLRAGLDEVDHARRTFGLASAPGAPVGPAALREATDALPTPSLEGLAVRTFRDACVGETVGAARARAEAERVTDPAVRLVLSEIAQDEERHAELAWRTLAWAVRVGGAPVSRALATALEDERAKNRGDVVFEAVVAPCAETLLASA